MFGTQLKHIAQVIAIAAVVAAVAVPAAGAGAPSCQPVSWTSVTDDLGLSKLVPVPSGVCPTAEISCTSVQTGWVSVNDALGVPFLVPTSPTSAAANGVCVLAQQPSSPAPAAKIVKAKITK